MSKLLSLRIFSGTSGLERKQMAAPELTSYADRVVVPVVPVTREVYVEPEFVPGDAASIFCLDMDSLEPEHTVRWVHRATSAALRNPDIIIPCLVVVGSTTNFTEEVAERIEKDLVAAGAVFIRLTKGQSFTDIFRELSHKISSVYGHLSHVGSAAPSSRKAPKLEEKRRARWRSRSGRQAAPSISPYVDPPRQLPDDEFDLLAERVDMSEEDPDFDD